VASALRGKGFAVVGVLDGGLQAWAGAHGTPTSTDVIEGDASVTGTILGVSDPGADAPEGATTIPIERLWDRVGEIAHDEPVTVVAGSGVRAALAVGMLERAGVEQISFWWRTRTPVPAKKKRRGLFSAFSD
jgi:hydroxyacylglutathione hydrolase